MKHPITLLIDGDILCYQIASSIEEELEVEEDLWTLWSDATEGKARVESELAVLTHGFKANQVIIAFSDKENFRKAVYPSYKANRKKTRKPVAYKPLVEHCKQEHYSLQIPTLEADDVLGILSTSPHIPGTKIIVSIDKDFKQIPGYLFNPNEHEPFKAVYNAKEDADLYFYTQILTGDATDGYPGCPGIGIKTVEKHLGRELPEVELWAGVKGLYAQKELTEKDALTQARCARILRYSDYDKENKKVKLWTPPKQKKGKK